MAERNKRKPGTPSAKEKAVIDKSKNRANPRIAMDTARIPETPDVGTNLPISDSPRKLQSGEPEMFSEIPVNAAGEPDFQAAEPTEEWKDWAQTNRPLDTVSTSIKETGYTPRLTATTPVSTSGAADEEKENKRKKREQDAIAKGKGPNTPEQAKALLDSNAFGDSGIVGITPGQTAAYQEIYEGKKRAKALSAIQAYADMFEGYFDLSPEAKKKHDKEVSRRVLAHQEWTKQAGLGVSGMINSVLKGISKYKSMGGEAPLKVAKGAESPNINVDLANESKEQAREEDIRNRALDKGRHDVTNFGPGKLPKEPTERFVTPHAQKLWKEMLADHVATFKRIREGIRIHAKAEGVAKAHANHDRLYPVGDFGVVQCGNPGCVAGQTAHIKAARLNGLDPEELQYRLQQNFARNHDEEATAAAEINADRECEKRGYRMDESVPDYLQPSHTEEQCPFVHPETGEKITLINDAGQPYICNNHLGDIGRDGKPKASDLSTFPLALTYTTTTTDKHGNKLPTTVHIQNPGLEDFLKNPKYREVEDVYNLKNMLNEHAKENPGVINPEYLRGSYQLNRSALSKAVDIMLGRKGRFEREMTKPGSDAILATGATSYRAPGYENMDSFGTHNSAKKQYIDGLVRLGLKYYQQRKNLPNDIADIVANAKDKRGSQEAAEKRVEKAKENWVGQAEGLLKAHGNRSARIRVTRSAAQKPSGGVRLITPEEAGFLAEGRERGEGTDRFQNDPTSAILNAGNAIAEASGTITGDTRSFVPPAATGGNRSSGVPGSMPISQPRRDPATIAEEPEPTLKNYSTTGAPVTPSPTVKTAEETEADIKAYAAKKKAQRKASKSTQPPEATLQ